MATADLAGKKVLVVGAGIAGTALAIALGRLGVPTEVVDLDDHTDGAHIGLTNRAVDALAELGVLDEVAAAGTVQHDNVFTRMYTETGRPVRVPPPPRPESALPASIGVYRPELARILKDAAHAAGATFRYGVSVDILRQETSGVQVLFTDGSAGHYPLVVGADGVRSKVRRLLWPDLRPHYTGTVALRWMLDEEPPDQPGFYTSATEMVAVAPVRGGRTYVASGAQSPEGHRVTPAQARALLLSVLGRFPALSGLHGRLADDQTVLAHPYEWIMTPAPWYDGRVLLIGDAAHATTAHLSSGGGMALEDAVVLAQELASPAGLDEALAAFVERRFDRVELVVSGSVRLLKMHDAGAAPADMAAVRARATGVLIQPY